MAAPDTPRYAKIPLTHGSGAIPALGFGMLIPDPLATKQATKAVLEAGFRHFDCAERYGNEQAVGDAMQEMFKAEAIQRKDVFVTTMYHAKGETGSRRPDTSPPGPIWQNSHEWPDDYNIRQR